MEKIKAQNKENMISNNPLTEYGKLKLNSNNSFKASINFLIFQLLFFDFIKFMVQNKKIID